MVCPLLPSKQVVTYSDAYGDGDAAPESGGVLFATDSEQDGDPILYHLNHCNTLPLMIHSLFFLTKKASYIGREPQFY